jgi:hypothetical protein
MAINDLFDYMRNATHQMQSEYERIRRRATEDPGTAGDNGEENWAALLRKWLPASYHVVTKGRIMNTQGDCGPQVDVLVLSPAYPEALLDKKEYLEGGVLAAFECKLTLKAQHIDAFTRNAAQIRRLSHPGPKGTPYKELHGRVLYGLLAHSHSWQGAASTPLENISNQLLRATGREPNHPSELPDVICVSDLAVWSTFSMLIAGPEMLSQSRIRYEQLGPQWNDLRNTGGLIETTHICSTGSYQHNEEGKEHFTPIGSLIASLLAKLAWKDPGLRPLAEYFIVANLLGSGQGTGRVWPLSVLSDELASLLRRGGRLTVGERWNEWNMNFQ